MTELLDRIREVLDELDAESQPDPDRSNADLNAGEGVRYAVARIRDAIDTPTPAGEAEVAA